MISRTVGMITLRRGSAGTWEIWVLASQGNLMVRLVHHLPEPVARETVSKLQAVINPLHEKFHPDSNSESTVTVSENDDGVPG